MSHPSSWSKGRVLVAVKMRALPRGGIEQLSLGDFSALGHSQTGSAIESSWLRQKRN